jgi:hypothetical protein
VVVVTAPPASLAPWDEAPGALEGAGVVSSWGDAVESDKGDPFEVVFTGTAAALDTLGFVADPLGSLFGAGLGWLIEHLSILREPLDALAGDPVQITSAANAWHKVSVEMAAVATELRGPGAAASGPAAPPPGWEGAACEGYGAAVADRAGRIDFVGRQCDQLAVSLLKQGALVGTARSLMRDSLVDLVTSAIEWAATGALAAAVTGGMSLVAAAGGILARAAELGTRFGRWVAELLNTLADAGHALSGLAGGVRDAARAAGGTGVRLKEWAAPLDETIGDVPLGDEFIEAGKQFSKTDPENLED